MKGFKTPQNYFEEQNLLLKKIPFSGFKNKGWKLWSFTAAASIALIVGVYFNHSSKAEVVSYVDYLVEMDEYHLNEDVEEAYLSFTLNKERKEVVSSYLVEEDDWDELNELYINL